MRDLILKRMERILADSDSRLELEFFRGGVTITSPDFFEALDDAELLDAFEDAVGFNG